MYLQSKVSKKNQNKNINKKSECVQNRTGVIILAVSFSFKALDSRFKLRDISRLNFRLTNNCELIHSRLGETESLRFFHLAWNKKFHNGFDFSRPSIVFFDPPYNDVSGYKKFFKVVEETHHLWNEIKDTHRQCADSDDELNAARLKL